MVGPPKVINKKVDDKLLEPYEVIFSVFALPASLSHQDIVLTIWKHTLDGNSS